MFTFEMQQVRDNFENSLKKIQILSDNNYDLKKSIFQEKLKFQHITSLMKEFKMRTNFMANKINNYKATTHLIENNNNNEKRINWSSKKKSYIDANANNKTNKRPFSSAYTNNKARIQTFGTNYTQNNTNPRMFSENNLKRSSKIGMVSDSNILYNKTDREEDKRKDLKLSVLNNEIISMTEGNIDNIKRKKNYEKNIINVLRKDIEIWKNKIVNIVNKYKDNIPDNEIYSSLTKIVEALRLDKSNKFFGQNNNNVVNTSMLALPVQNKQFRKIFLDLLFRNKEIFEAIRTGQKNDVDKYFNKNLFGAEKIKK